MAARLAEYLRNIEAQRPSFKATGNPVAWPDEALL